MNSLKKTAAIKVAQLVVDREDIKQLSLPDTLIQLIFRVFVTAKFLLPFADVDEDHVLIPYSQVSHVQSINWIEPTWLEFYRILMLRSEYFKHFVNTKVVSLQRFHFWDSTPDWSVTSLALKLNGQKLEYAARIKACCFSCFIEIVKNNNNLQKLRRLNPTQYWTCQRIKKIVLPENFLDLYHDPIHYCSICIKKPLFSTIDMKELPDHHHYQTLQPSYIPYAYKFRVNNLDSLTYGFQGK